MSTVPTTPTLVVRPATSADLRAIDALPGLSTSTRRSLARDLERAGSGEAAAPLALVAEDSADPDHVAHGRDAEVVGAEVVGVALGLLQHDEGHVLDLAVHPAYRRQGVGSRLLRALLAALLARGARAVTLEVRAGNLGAQALYRAHGCTVEGRRPGYYPDGEDALLLWWRPATSPPGGTEPSAAGPTTTADPTRGTGGA